MTPKINYRLIADALAFYESIGFEYVEVPWIVSEYTVRATLPEGADFMQIGVACNDDGLLLQPYYGGENALVGSAEQGFLQMALPPGQYVGVTPCFRCEDRNDLFYQDCFMKVELFDNRDSAGLESTLNPALAFFKHITADAAKPKTLVTAEGTDITIGGVEVGSYGVREHPDFGRWVYGTGLALPRFSVANALARVL